MEMTLQELLRLGGWAMWPLLLFSVVTLSLIIERTVYYISHSLRVEKISAEVMEKVNSGDVAGALDYCNSLSKRSLAAPIFSEALKVADMGEHRLEKALEVAASQKINLLERGFDLLIALGSIAPITGFLGTVSGMIGAFRSIANANEVDAKLVANGIFEALITTAYGLAIAILAITGYNIFVHIADRFAAKIEDSANKLVAALAYGDNKKTNE